VPAVAPARLWVDAARPRTLPAAVAPVLVGTASAVAFHPWRFVGALVVALGVQVGVNYANDYYDGVRGVDTAARVGPRRAVAAGLVPPRAMRAAMLLAFSVAAVAGLLLARATTWWLVAVGAVCFLAALGYSGGPRPYASAGLGELFVFVFFGLVATVGSAFVQDEMILPRAVAAAVPVGLLAVAILVANNLRDIPTDAEGGKRTLAVRLGARRTRTLYVALLYVALLATVAVAVVDGSPWPLVGLAAGMFVPPLARAVRQGAAGPDLVAVLAGTARLQLLYSVLLAAGLLQAVRVA
jgi:1,4-dihydroxy-2-naphthoate polyprenyltransferase